MEEIHHDLGIFYPLSVLVRRWKWDGTWCVGSTILSWMMIVDILHIKDDDSICHGIMRMRHRADWCWIIHHIHDDYLLPPMKASTWALLRQIMIDSTQFPITFTTIDLQTQKKAQLIVIWYSLRPSWMQAVIIKVIPSRDDWYKLSEERDNGL